MKGDLGGEGGGGAEADEVGDFGADGAVFGEVSAGLAHEPDGRGPDLVTGEDAQEFFGHGIRCLGDGRDGGGACALGIQERLAGEYG